MALRRRQLQDGDDTSRTTTCSTGAPARPAACCRRRRRRARGRPLGARAPLLDPAPEVASRPCPTHAVRAFLPDVPRAFFRFQPGSAYVLAVREVHRRGGVFRCRVSQALARFATRFFIDTLAGVGYNVVILQSWPSQRPVVQLVASSPKQQGSGCHWLAGQLSSQEESSWSGTKSAL